MPSAITTNGQAKTYDEICAIIRSLKSVKGLRLRIGAAFWGEEFAADSEKLKYMGTVNRWNDPSTKQTLMVLWEGYTQCQRAPIDKMQKTESGTELDLELLPYEDGVYPSLQEEEATVRPHRQPPEDAPTTLDVDGQCWTRRCSTYVDKDSRSEERFKPSLNSGGNKLESIEELFNFFLPEQWLADILKYTNPKLDNRDSISAKLTEGELLRFFGYMLSLSIHKGVPLDKMWSKTSIPNSTAPPPMMGRHGMSQNRFFKIRSVFTCGPTDDASFADNEWCFVENILNSFNSSMQDKVIPGWLLAPDESMSAWRGKVGRNNFTKIPKLMFVRRKPEPLGAEFKNIGDALSGLILRMEITKGKAEATAIS
ncbi:hypothetical protein AB1Y20_003446 [Prymnesium parvum]|uniref:PiggyBac transposable element-derived protein domain-containing protein n=1 Tax=Prymnesium parvum TaxID=97485 RepID=A0AB34JC11_PRYPA